MTAATTAERSASGKGLRPFDAGRDLSALADLIEAGFSKSLDRSGRRMVQGLRMFGRLGWLGGVLSRWILPPAANPQGFVWEENGRVLGNASLLPVTGYPHRWVMANVTVLPEQRRRGIGRSLVTASIEHAHKRGAREIVLQVDRDNESALMLYQSLGFSNCPPKTTWVGRASHATPKEISGSIVRRRSDSEWRHQWELARRLHPEGLVWPYPPDAGFFRPGPWQQRLRLNLDRHWVWFDDERLLGSISFRWGLEPGHVRMLLLVDPESQGKIESDLLMVAMQSLQPYGDSIVVDYLSDVAEASFKKVGFSEKRQLVWMNRTL